MQAKLAGIVAARVDGHDPGNADQLRGGCGMKADLVELALLAVYAAALFTLVRPNSQGPVLLQIVGETLVGVVSSAMGNRAGADLY
jgi:hypothetical protein